MASTHARRPGPGLGIRLLAFGLGALLAPGAARGQRLRITSPRAGSTVRGSTSFAVTTRGLPPGTTVEYRVGSRRVVEPRDARSPGARWDSRALYDGRFAVRAVARDARGGVIAQSPPVVVDVSNGAGASALRLASPPEGQALSGRARFAFAVDRDVTVLLLVDGHDAGVAWHTPAALEFDTTVLEDGEHELSATAWLTRGPNDIVPVGMVQRVFTTANGRAPRALRHRYAEAHLAPGETIPPAWSLGYCDGSAEPAPGGTVFESTDPSVAQADASGAIRALAPGEAEVRARRGDREGRVRVVVDADRALPHFARDGEILREYVPGRSAFVRAVFELGPAAVTQDPRLGPAAVAAGVNTLTSGFYYNPADQHFQGTFAQWRAAWEATGWAPVERTARALDMSVLLTGDDVARTPAELSDTLTRPWAADALRLALEHARDLHRVIGIEMVDEASFAYGPSPRPASGAWARFDPPLPDDAIARLMDVIHSVPGRPNVTWPVGGLGDASVSRAWMGDPAFSDYASQYWTLHRPWRAAYPYAVSLPQDRDGMDTSVLLRSYARFRHVPQLMGVSVAGPFYRKRAEGSAYQPGRDELISPPVRPEEISAEVMYAVARGMAGVRAYTLDVSYLEARARATAPFGQPVQTGAEPFVVGTDRWQAMASAFHLVAEIEPWIFQSRACAPDLGPDVVTGAREGPRGRAVIAVNFSERAQSVRLDLPAFAPDPGAEAVRYRLAGASLRAERVAAGAEDALTLAPGESVVWCLPRAGSPGADGSPPDAQPPAVALVSPAPDAALPAAPELALSAEVSGERGPVRVRFSVDGQSAGEADAPPYAVRVPTAALSRGVWHGVGAVAVDAAGNASEARAAVMLLP